MSQWNKQLHTTNTFLIFENFDIFIYLFVGRWLLFSSDKLNENVSWLLLFCFCVVVVVVVVFFLSHGHIHLYKCTYMCHHTCISILVNVLAPRRAWPNEAAECIHKIATQVLTLLDGDLSELCSNANKFMILSAHLKKKNKTKQNENKTKTKNNNNEKKNKTLQITK